MSGDLPGWLRGGLLRAGPAQWEIGGSPVGHWFDGLTLLSSFTVADGSVGYASKLLDTREQRSAREGRREQAIYMRTDPCRRLGQRLALLFDPSLAGNPNVNVARLGERYIAMTETPAPVEFDAGTLRTLGHVRFRDGIRDLIGPLAHPHFDAATGAMICFGTHIGLRGNEHRLYTWDGSSSARRQFAAVPTGRNPSYMHSFGLTERFIVLTENAVTYSLPAILRGGKVADGFRFHPDRPGRFVVVDRRSGDVIGTHETQPFFSWHQANCFEDGDELVIDLVVNDAAHIFDLDLDKLRDPGFQPRFAGELRRFRLPPDGRGVRSETLSGLRLEFPRINYDHNTHDYRYVYAIAYSDHRSDWFDQIVKVDVTTGEHRSWREDGCYPSEPLFAAAPGAGAEDDGVILNIVLDAARRRSFLLVLDARSLAELARAYVPHHLPFNFHQQYFPAG